MCRNQERTGLTFTDLGCNSATPTTTVVRQHGLTALALSETSNFRCGGMQQKSLVHEEEVKSSLQIAFYRTITHVAQVPNDWDKATHFQLCSGLFALPAPLWSCRRSLTIRVALINRNRRALVGPVCV